jgi:hypothetical protein
LYPSLLDPTDTSRNFENTGQDPYIYYTVLNNGWGLDRDLVRQQIHFGSLIAPAPLQLSYNSTNSQWKGSEPYLLLWSNGGHPGEGADAVRRWTAPQDGNFQVTGRVKDTDAGCGSGVNVSVKQGDNILWQNGIANGDTTGISFTLAGSIAKNDYLDFVINRGSDGNNGCDSTFFDPVITFNPGVISSPTPTVSPSATATPTPKVGDLNNDGIVNSFDWAYMNSKWYTDDPIADINKDGIVNTIDFSMMNANWLK